MAGPWENYAPKPEPKSGPWQKYGTQAPAEDSGEIVATTDDGGRVIKSGDGSLSFTSPNYSTTDPDKIKSIMAGATSAEASMAGFDASTIAQAPVTARAVKAVEGVPFVGSFVDEAAGAMFGDAAQQGVRAVSGAMDRQNPNESLALGVAGSVAGAIPMALAAAPTLAANAANTIGARAIQGASLGALAGGVEGTVYGAGTGTDAQSRGQGAVQGGILGGATGGVLGAAAPYAAEGIKRALEAVKGSDVAAISSALGISKPAAKAVRAAIDSGDMRSAEDAIRRAGPDAMLADAGQPARQLLDAAANTGGAAGRVVTDAVSDRVVKTSSEVTAILDSTLGKPSGLREMARNVREGTAAARAKTYEAAYASPIDYSRPNGKSIQSLLTRVPQSAINDANELMRLEGVTSKQIMATIGDDGRITYQQLPDVRQIDYITRAMAGVADRADGAGKLGGQTPLGRGYNELTRLIRQTLRKEVPEYAKALDTAADAISRVKAGEAGYSLLRPSVTRETIRESLSGASKAEKAAMKEGVRTYIDDLTANVTAVFTDTNRDAREAVKSLRLMSTRANQEKLELLLGPKESARLFGEMDRLTTTFELRAALAENSKTARRMALQGEVDELSGPRMLEVLASGEPIHAAKRFVQLFTGNTAEAQALRKAGIYEEIAKALTQIKGDRAMVAVRTVNDAMAGQKISEQRAAYIGQILATSGFLTGNRQGTTLLTTQ